MYSDTLLITGERGSEVKIKDLIEYIRKNNIENKYLFIDEIQLFKDYTTGPIQLLYDELVRGYNFKVFVTGTWSQYITIMAENDLFGRVDMFELLPITFTDDKIYFNRDIREHCMNGGYIQNVRQDASVKDAMFSIKHFLKLATNYDDIQIEAVSRYLTTSINEISYNNFRKFLEKNKIVLQGKYVLDIEYLLSFKKHNFLEIIRILSNSGLYKSYISISDITKDSIELSYISRNNLLSYYLTQSLQNVEKDKNLIKYEKLGVVFEDAIRVLLLSNSISADKVRTETGDFEIDILSDRFIAEVKLSDKKRSEHYKNLMNIEYLKKFNLENKTKLLVYNGETYYNKEYKILSQNIYDFEKEYNIKLRIDSEQRKNYNEGLNQVSFNLKW